MITERFTPLLSKYLSLGVRELEEEEEEDDDEEEEEEEEVFAVR